MAENPLKVSGIAQLCFLEDGSWFQGHLITEGRDQYGLMGKPGDTPDKQFHECCFHDIPEFYSLTVIDHNLTLEMDIENEICLRHVMKNGGDNCSLTSEEVDFYTDELFVGKKAEEFIANYFKKSLLGKNCFVCVGKMEIKQKRRLEPEPVDAYGF